MGIINVTPDSFSDGGLYYSPEKAVARGIALAEEGADIIDIGGESSRPGADAVSPQEQMDRVCPVMEKLRGETDALLSVDTTSSRVAEESIAVGADIINDISALRFDEDMIDVAVGRGVGLILMHMKGTPKDMQQDPYYEDIIGEITGFLKERIDYAEARGVDSSKIVVDPGIGFGKTVDGNLEILRNISRFRELGKPVLIGASRKSFLGAITGASVENRLAGSLAAACLAALNGVDILRVHNIKETVDALKIVAALSER